MNEGPANDSWTTIHVFVVAPRREVHVPVMQLQRYIPYCMGQIPAHCYTQRPAVTRYQLNVEELARVELYARQKDKSRTGGVV